MGHVTKLMGHEANYNFSTWSQMNLICLIMDPGCISCFGFEQQTHGELEQITLASLKKQHKKRS